MNYHGLSTLFHKVGKLKSTKRSGWVRHKVRDPESVADHSYRTAFIAMILGDILKMDTQKLIKMALIHDLAEAVAGDITPHDGLSKEEKHRKEEMGLRQLLKDVPNGNVYLDLWNEYEEQKTREAVILKNIDKLEMATQAREYQQVFPDKDLSEFILEADKYINTTEIRSLFEEVKEEWKNE